MTCKTTSFDCIVIGGGISGLSCAIACVNEGLSCAVITSGMGCLHFSSGSIDLLGYHPGRTPVIDPFEALPSFIKAHKDHPYAACGTDLIEEALFFIQRQVEKEGLLLYADSRSNHFIVTALGTLKPTFFSLKSVYGDDIKHAFENKQSIAMLNFNGFRDFHPELAAENLKKNDMFKDCNITTGTIDLYEPYVQAGCPGEIKTMDISRVLDGEKNLEAIASQIKDAAKGAKIACIPAFAGIKNYNHIHKTLCRLTDMSIYEIPTLPPSIIGMRLDEALKSRFVHLGGIIIAGDRVNGGTISKGKLDHIHTQNYEDTNLSAPFYVLATGSFISNGLTCDYKTVKEPVFDLFVDYPEKRDQWYSPSFFHHLSHPFLEFGVKTNSLFNPFTRSGEPVENLFCTGSVLANYNPIQEATGCGVAITSGYFAAKQIIHALGPGKMADYDKQV